jgi:hypothetical protein
VSLAAGRVGSEPGAWRGAVLGAAVGCLLLAGYPELVCFTARVVVEEDEPESVTLRVRAPERALLVVSDLFWPGWSVTVDGGEREMYRVDYLLRGVPIEPGEHTVRFRYAPARVRLGAVLPGGTLLMLGMGAVVHRTRRARASSDGAAM